MIQVSRRIVLVAVASAGLAACAGAPIVAAEGQYDTSAGPVEVTRMAADLQVPWAVAFLPEGGFLVTEREGRLTAFIDGERRLVRNVPQVAAFGQGGLLDVAAARDFETSREIFLTYAEPRGAGTAATALAVGRLSEDATLLDQVRVIWRMQPATSAGQHFGARVVEAADGTLFVTTGDRGDRDQSQDPTNTIGTVVRVNRDGSVPADNPFADQPGVRGEIWSWGLRNLQGAALDGQGVLWTVMHGPRGGDEVNVHATPGLNYGWPLQSFGVEYASRRQVGTPGPVEGVEDPVFWWETSPAVSGLVVYSGRLFPAWEGNLLTGALQHDTIIRLEGGAEGMREAERLLEGDFRRIRDVREAPDGSIWFIAETEGAIYRMAPGQGS